MVEINELNQENFKLFIFSVVQKNPFETPESKMKFLMDPKVRYQLPHSISHKTIKLPPIIQHYMAPYKIVHKFKNMEHNLNAAHDYEIQHNDHKTFYKYLQIPENEEVNVEKFEEPVLEHYVDFSSRDYHHDEPQIFVTEANYKYLDEHENSPGDEDKNKIVEARDELMKILAQKAVERREINKNNNETAKVRNKRSFVTWWTNSARSSGKDEKLEVPEEEKSENYEEENFISGDEKWLAGCLMQCVFNKNAGIDRLGYPTLDGIVDMYTKGTMEQPFFMYTLRATNKCLRIVSNRYNVNRKKKPAKGLTCTLAYDVFECVSDAISAYCKT